MSQQNNGRGGAGPYADDAAASDPQTPDSSEVDPSMETVAADDAMDRDPDDDLGPDMFDAGAPPRDDMISREVHRAALDAETADLRDKLLRAAAETENMRKRMEREVAQARKFAVAAFVKDIIPLTDTFQRAIEAVPDEAAAADPALKSLMDGVTMTERQFMNVMEKHGVKRIEPKGEIFNPNFHQAIAQFPNPDVPVGTIMEVAQAGFVLDSRVMRPAMVVVAQGGPKPDKAASAPGGEDAVGANSATDIGTEPREPREPREPAEAKGHIKSKPAAGQSGAAVPGGEALDGASDGGADSPDANAPGATDAAGGGKPGGAS